MDSPRGTTADRPTPARPRRPYVRLVAYTLLLFASWNHNLLGLPDGPVWSRADIRAGYLGSESNLVVGRLALADAHPFHPLAGPGPGGDFVPYPSQVGLTGIGLAAVGHLLGVPGSTVAGAAGAGFALLTALVVSAVFAAGHRWLGPPAGDVACVLAAASPVFLPFAPSLYWVPWLLLAPFALAWCFYPAASTPGRRAALLAAVGLAVLAKCLCGYEYVTAVVLAPVAATWFHQHRAGDPPARRARAALALVGVGLLGFAAAMGLHVAQQGVVFGADGFAVIRDRAVARTASDPGAEAARAGAAEGEPSRLGFAVRCFLGYFDQRAVAVAGGFGRVRRDVPLKAVVGAVVALAVAAGVGRKRLPREAAALAGASLLGLAAGVSWQVLAVNHMCVHRHLNLIVFAVPFLPLAYLGLGYAVRLAVGDAVGRWVGPSLLVAAGGVMGVNAVADGWRAAAENAEQVAAEAEVAARLGGPLPGPGAGLGGGVDVIRPMADVPATLLLEYGLLDLATARPPDPGALVLDGWALGDCKTAARPTTRVVVATGGVVVPGAARRFRRPDIERPVGKALPGSGFVAVVPSACLAAGAPVRVFVVSSADPTHIAELAVGP